MNFLRRARFDDLQMPVVLDECPDEVGSYVVEHFPIVVEEWNASGAAFVGFRHQIGNGLGYAGEPRVLTLEHRAQVSPDVRMDQADHGHLVVRLSGKWRPERRSRRGCLQEFSSGFHGFTFSWPRAPKMAA